MLRKKRCLSISGAGAEVTTTSAIAHNATQNKIELGTEIIRTLQVESVEFFFFCLQVSTVKQRKEANTMAVLAIESALDVAIMFGNKDMIEVYSQALEDAGIHYESHAKSWMEAQV